MSKNTYAGIENTGHPLKLDEDIPLHIKGWKIQKVAWTIIGLFLLLAAIGLFGAGPLSYRTINANGDILEYEHFGRFQGQTQLEFTLNRESGIAKIAFSLAYLDKFQIERIFPLPDKTETLGHNIIYTFNVTDRAKIIFYMVPQKAGSIEGTITVNKSVFNLSQFIYP